MRTKSPSVIAALAPPTPRRTPAILDTAPEPSPPPSPARALDALRQKHREGDINTATALLVGLAGGPRAHALLEELVALDGRSAAKGHLSRADEERRAAIWNDAVARLGFNPLTENERATTPSSHDAPARSLEAPQPVPLLELTEGLGGQLRGGDWAGLWNRVAAGQLSEADARAIAATWLSHHSR